MRTYALKRLLISVPLVFVMTFVVFCIINLSSADRFDSFLNDPQADPQVVEQEARRLHMHEPVPVRYMYWLQGVLFDMRLGRDRRYLASFEDNDPERRDDRYKFGGTESRLVPDGVAGTYEVGGKSGAPLGSLGAAEGVKRLFELETVERVDFMCAAPAPEGLALIVMAGSGPQPIPFEKLPDGGAILKLNLDELVSRAAIDQIKGISVDSKAPGKAVIRAEAVQRRIWQITYPGHEHKRAIQVTFRGEPGQYAELGRLKSPYLSKVVDGTTWKADWNKVRESVEERVRKETAAWEKAGRKGAQPEVPTLEGTRFDTLEFEGTALAGEPFKVDIELLIGPQESPTPVKVGEAALVRERKTFAIPLSAFPPGTDLTQVRGLRLRSDARGKAEFDDFRLRIDQSLVSFGWPNFGQSWGQKQGVISLIAEKVKNTILLNLWALVFIWIIALPAGIYGAVRQYTTGDKVISFVTFIGMAMPSFFLAILLIFLVTLTYDIPETSWFSWLRNLLPISGRTSPDHGEMGWWRQNLDIARHMVLPALVGILGGIGGLQRVVRGNMLEERRKLYVTTAMAKGLPPRSVLYKHALRNAIIPFVASAGGILPAMIGGSAFVEIVFDYPGIGRQMLDSVQSYDIPVVMANTLIVGLLLIVGNLLADIALGLVDPRISLES